MRPPPPPTEAPKYPVTAGLALLAIVTTILVLRQPADSSHKVDLYGLFTMDLRAFLWPPDGQPWRLLSATLPHGGWVHLAFNVIWLWTFGAQLEERYGHLRFAALLVLLAVASAAAEYAFFAGGVGLSGIGYGLWGFRYAMSKRDPRSIDLMDERTTVTFVIWFFICIASTYTGLMRIANVAHGVGAITGLAIGYATARAPRWTLRPRAIAGTIAALIVLGSGLLATVFRPVVNHQRYAGTDAADVAIGLLKQGRIVDARRYFHRCLEYTPRQDYCDYMLALTAQLPEGEPVSPALFD